MFMCDPSKKERRLTLLKRLLRVHAIGWTITRELINECNVAVDEGLADQLANLLGSGVANAAGLYRQPIVDHAAMAVVWAGRPCHLGNTVLLRLMDRLARRPNQYVPFDRLVRDTWNGQRVSDEAIRNAVHRLKRELRRAGMVGLATAIRSAGRSYGLILADSSP